MKKNSADSLSDLLRPLPLPPSYTAHIQKLSVAHQIAIALMLNLLSLAMPIMMLQVYDRIIPHQSYSTLVMLLLWVMVALAIDALLRTMRAWLVGWSASSHEHHTSCAALNHLIRADSAEFGKTSTGEHLKNMTAIGRLREFYSSQAMIALIDLPFASVFLILIAYLGGKLVLVPLTLIIIFMISARFSGERLKQVLKRRSDADDKKSSFVVTALSGIHTAKAMAFEAPLMRRFEQIQVDVTNESYSVAQASAKASNLSNAFGQLSLILTAACLLSMVT